MDKMNFFDYLNTTLKQNESNISQTIDQKIGFLASLNVAQAGLVALTSTETVILIASDGLAAPVAASIALNVAAVGLLITADVFEGTTIDEARDAKTI
jgi:hypothetical protein